MRRGGEGGQCLPDCKAESRPHARDCSGGWVGGARVAHGGRTGDRGVVTGWLYWVERRTQDSMTRGSNPVVGTRKEKKSFSQSKLLCWLAVGACAPPPPHPPCV